MPDTPVPTENKRATARPQVYIEVSLADGQTFLFDISTATELKNELAAALKSLNPPEKRKVHSPPVTKRRKRRKNK